MIRFLFVLKSFNTIWGFNSLLECLWFTKSTPWQNTQLWSIIYFDGSIKSNEPHALHLHIILHKHTHTQTYLHTPKLRGTNFVEKRGVFQSKISYHKTICLLFKVFNKRSLVFSKYCGRTRAGTLLIFILWFLFLAHFDLGLLFLILNKLGLFVI